MTGRIARAYAVSRFALELDGEHVGFVTQIDGGHFRADTIADRSGPNAVGRKFLARPRYDEISLSVGMAQSPSLWRWVKQSLKNDPIRVSGALVSYDFNNKEHARRNFYRAILSEIGFPALDAANAHPAYLSLKLAPEQLSFEMPGPGTATQLTPNQAKDEATSQKRWLQQNFSFEIDHLPLDIAHTVKIEPVTLKQRFIDNPIGSRLESTREPGLIDISNVQVTFSATRFPKWIDWYRKSVVEGESADRYTGRIVYRAPNHEELMQLQFKGARLVSLELDPFDANKEALARFRATLQIEELSLEKK